MSSKDDIDCHTVDIETRHESTVDVLVWSDRLTITIYKHRMDHYLSTDVEDSCRRVLVDFQHLCIKYLAHKSSIWNSKEKEKHTTLGFGDRLPGGQKGLSRCSTKLLSIKYCR